MTKYRNTLAAALMLAVAGGAAQARAWSFDEVYAPRAVPGLELASLEVPVAAKARPAEAPTQAPQAPALESAPEQPAAPPTLWRRFRDYLGF
ncbi:hypothetical protein NNJEOMEG_01525 [Fundidesulfovibrio magnetotacticus]|uniref:Uncharacterized protein n=1 Tax=Fundidesulfovibrio magnetotacticus TaxID=2730080 RepID=A0A6V8LSX9_9BACT|nr:hypothetical protein [Fundidesulfovibrio magnetotacticus]GFK93691.1 hypothetical protein NNJEOMEG_01525 [Fundidesulfovibrio magnetotacticus]